MIPACPSLMCSFSMGNIEGTNSLKFFVWCLCMYILCLWSDWFCRLTWQRVDIYVRRVYKCVFAYDLSLTVLRWPCVVDRTLKSNYYYYYILYSCSPVIPQLWHFVLFSCNTSVMVFDILYYSPVTPQLWHFVLFSCNTSVMAFCTILL